MPELAEPPLGLQNEYRDPFIRRIKPVERDLFDSEMRGINARLTEARQQQEKFETKTEERFAEARQQQEKFETKTEERFAEARQRQESFETKTEERFDKIDARFDKIDAKFDKIDAKFDKLDAKIDAQGTELRERIDAQGIELRQEIKDVRQEIKSSNSRQTQLLAVVIAAIGLLVVLMRFIDQTTVDAILGR
ncbi:MAG: hypothetical protein LBP75_01840 [Planctomycetota bacterium]|jgi:DNA repair exonuclease SbcCD ATPase subunit|nr:hypothetical protein [Planctomycetota bacterium]